MSTAIANISTALSSYKDRLEYTMPPVNDWVLPVSVFAALGFGAAVYKSIFAMGDYADSAGLNLPLVAEPEGKKSFALKTRLRYYYDCAALYTEAYRKV